MSTIEEILEKVLTTKNLQEAWKAVKRNKGGAGVDRKTIEDTENHLKIHWPVIRQKLREGKYRPEAVREVEIPKANDKIRTLGIPTVQDRLIQQAIHQVLTPIFDPEMSDHSYGFRPGKSAHEAIAAAKKYVEEGRMWVVDIDLKDFFNQINHDKLMHKVSQKVRDKTLLHLIGNYLRAPMQSKGGMRKARQYGVPQGGPLSPLLANIYLDPLDKELENRGISFVRYADDIAIFARSERAAQRIMGSVIVWLKKHLGLEVNKDKSGTGPSDESALLGFRIDRSGAISVAPKAITRLKEKIRTMWDARQSRTSKELRDRWRSYIDGWWNYFSIVNCRRNISRLAGWTRRHMRKCFWQRWHNKKGRRNALNRLGIRGRALGIAGTRIGAWPMARHVIVQQALKTKTLNRYGLGIPWEMAVN